jgi:hypothetical protein
VHELVENLEIILEVDKVLNDQTGALLGADALVWVVET